MSKKLDFNYIKVEFEKKGYTMVSKEYNGNRHKLEVICPFGHKINMDWRTFSLNCDCKECSGNRKYTYEEVVEIFKEVGYTLLSTNYKKNSQKLEFICDHGHTHEISINKLKQGRRCARCKGKYEMSYLEICQFFLDKNCKIIDNEENFDKDNINYICKNNHKTSVRLKNFKADIDCRYCYGESVRRENNPMWNNDKTDEERLNERKYREYDDWRVSVFERDNYTCRRCNSTKKTLNAHHILNYSKHKDLRTDINNGITLCEDCHKEFHKKYSRTNNNKDQIDSFILTKEKINQH